ncbi:DUF4245 domain-containing protein [Terracoccus luteus]|uniref:DUF4245 family protein n=1 Tax=Terracoccus luteus TaxID=53356 RepID=A0A839PVD0_9MICO|nr:DUF4245 domain-containing protein [Terracoccus luteus]MBB2985926.1 hypothetical protein [Terracoccus luteus]MCP2171578.1 hypothetical protein [Terracoccus luteus]
MTPDAADPVAADLPTDPSTSDASRPAALRAPGESEPAAEAPPRSRYSMGTLPNMLRSMLAIGFFVLLLVALVPRISQVDRPAIDASAKASQTAAQTGWAIELPAGLGSDWTPTVATYAKSTDGVETFTTVWKAPGGGDIALKEAADATNAWLTRSVADGAREGERTVSGRTFDRYATSDGQVSYVVRGEGEKALTLVATSSATEDELTAFVAALRPVTPSDS